MSRRQLVVFLIFTIHVILMLLFFDPKAHPGGDDSDYVVAARDFWEGVSFPMWHGSFYPIMLSPFVAAFGINLVALKLLSLVCTFLSSLFLYHALRERVPTAVLLFGLAMTCFCQTLVLYGSSTYSEPLFLCLQSLVIFFYVRVRARGSFILNTGTLCLAIVLALAVFLLSATRNVAFGACIAIAFSFAIEKRFRDAIVLSIVFVAFHGLFFLYKALAWGKAFVGVEGQWSRIAYKNFYDPSAGSEDWTGFAQRFWENSQLYLSKHLMVLTGLRSADVSTTSAWLTVLLYAVFSSAIFVAYRRNRIVLFLLVYAGMLLAVTFITQQPHWDQIRLVMVFVPLITIGFGFLVYELTASKQKLIRYGGRTLLVTLPLVVLLRAMSAEISFADTIANLTHDPLRGYSDEWRNYVKASQWAGKHVPTNKNILCRKVGISTIYGDRRFVGISRFPYTVPDSAIALLRRREIDYVLHDNLSMPTVHRLLAYYLQKHPLGLSVVHVEGKRMPSALLAVQRHLPRDDREFFERVKGGLIIFPDHSYYYVMAADRYAMRTDYENAITNYSAALRYARTPEEQTEILHRRAQSFLLVNRPEKAQADLESLLSMHPGYANATQLLQDVRTNND